MHAQYGGIINAQAALENARNATMEADETLAQRLEVCDSCRTRPMLEAMRSGEAGAEFAEEVLRDIEFLAIRDAE